MLRVKTILLATSLVVAVNLSVFAQNENPRSRKYDEFSGDTGAEGLMARLDFFAIELQKEPETRGYIIMYRGRREPPGMSYRYVQSARDYLVESRGVSPNKIVAIDAGLSDCFLYELWMVPAGAALPERRYTYEKTTSEVTYLFDLLETIIENDFVGPPGVGGNEWHLTAFATELKKHPKSRAYIIVYPQYCTDCQFDGARTHLVRDSAVTVHKVLSSKKKYLVRTQGINESRITAINGGYRKWREIELWIVPPKGYPPTATPNQFPKK